MSKKLSEIKRAYFVGIGGIGMSALARYFNGRGVEIHGYDKTKTTLTETLSAEGMNIHYEDNVDFIPADIDLVVYTPAIPNTHKELTYFRNNGYDIKKRAEVLGIISRGMKALAIAGTHGKTSTTTILTHVLKTCGIDCTAFLGGIAKNFDSNYVEGQSDWVVIEADEFDRSFLQLNPTISAILSMDADHLDIYGDVSAMHESFGQFVSQTYDGGHNLVRHDLMDGLKANLTKEIDIKAFGIDNGYFRAEQIRVENGFFVFDFFYGNRGIRNIKFTMPGRHNVMNATVAIGIAKLLGGKARNIKRALRTFKGIKRRFEFIVRNNQQVFIDDYAHHPSELEAAIGAAKELYPNKKITGIFQPHLYSRTNDFQDGFAKALDMLDEIYLMDIYPARELPMKGVTSDIIFNKMKNPNKKRVTLENVLHIINVDNIEVLMTLGAGDIDTIVEPLRKQLNGH